MKTIEELLLVDDNVSKELKKAMAFANLDKKDLEDIRRLSGAKTKTELQFEVEKILFEGGVN